ncbi:MAG: universal stress protein [Bacteroidia bacterium]|nr:universal stress protein [Bacteroidia bacterium]
MLTHFTQIIAAYVPSEASKVALKLAVNLSKKHNAKLTILNVNPHKSEEGLVRRQIDEIMKDEHAEYGFVEKTGKPYKEILMLEKALDANLIVMGSHGSKERDPDWIGGNAFKVLSGSTCPVIIFPQDFPNKGFNNIVLPIGNSSETRQKVPLTVELASSFGATIHIAVVHKGDDPEVAHRLKIYADQAAKYCDDHEVAYTVKDVINKNIANACIDHADEVNADLISIMSERESETGFFMGHYAQELVNKAKTPVLTIHVKDMNLTGAAGY